MLGTSHVTSGAEKPGDFADSSGGIKDQVKTLPSLIGIRGKMYKSPVPG
jgi:hypothetical protein